MQNISIVTGTLNRLWCLPRLFSNTIESNDRLELVLVDGGSTDGSLDWIKERNHPRVRLIEFGRRSSYPHFMNLGIRNATHELICQWNDDVILTNPWDDVFKELDGHKVYIFAWTWTAIAPDGSFKLDDPNWKRDFWNIVWADERPVMNYGIYHKDVFRKIGLYHPEFNFYCADGDMSFRAVKFGFPFKHCGMIKVMSDNSIKKSNPAASHDIERFRKYSDMYRKGKLPNNLEYL